MSEPREKYEAPPVAPSGERLRPNEYVAKADGVYRHVQSLGYGIGERQTFEELARHINALEQRVADAERDRDKALQRNPELGYGYFHALTGAPDQGDGESTMMLYRTDQLAYEVSRETKRAEAAEARMRDLEQAIAAFTAELITSGSRTDLFIGEEIRRRFLTNEEPTR